MWLLKKCLFIHLRLSSTVRAFVSVLKFPSNTNLIPFHNRLVGGRRKTAATYAQTGERATVLLMRINVKITRSIKTGGRLEMIKTFRRLCNTCERSRRLTDQLIEMFRANYQLTADLPADRSLRRVLPGHGTVLASRGRGYYNNARYYVYLTAAGPVIIFKWRR